MHRVTASHCGVGAENTFELSCALAQSQQSGSDCKHGQIHIRLSHLSLFNSSFRTRQGISASRAAIMGRTFDVVAPYIEPTRITLSVDWSHLLFSCCMLRTSIYSRKSNKYDDLRFVTSSILLASGMGSSDISCIR